MKKITTKNKLGFSLLELMVVVAIIGVLATFAVPRFNIFRARARQGEAKSNLGVIFTLQEAFKIDKEEYYNGVGAGANGWGGADMAGNSNSVGYKTVSSANVCEANKLGFRLANCEAARYRYYIANANEDEFLAVAHAHSYPTNKRIFPGCNGDTGGKDLPSKGGVGGGTKCDTTYDADAKEAKGDAFCLDQQRVVDNYRDIVEATDCKN